MTQRILIDAIHPDEVRVAVADDSRLQEFDFENVGKKQIKSNIYLGKITRVEPSLQAAFVEYGGIRQGFLPFSEVHFDYFQIPVVDKEKIVAEIEAENNARGNDLDDDIDEAAGSAEKPKETNDKESDTKTVAAEAKDDAQASVIVDEADVSEPKPTEAKTADVDPLSDVALLKPKKLTAKQVAEAEAEAEKAKNEALERVFSRGSDKPKSGRLPRGKSSRSGRKDDSNSHALEGSRVVEVADSDDDNYEGEDVGGDDEADDARRTRGSFYRSYKIQEVLKRNQILLVQVIKEERGNKGASLTTYISLAGRYSVLMPNTDRSGGVSRRISDIKERKRLKSIINNSDLDKGTSIIVRTAGVGKEDADITRDFTYLQNLWEGIRQKAVHSTAPSLVHEEGDLIKRTLRDLFRGNIDEVYVEGEDAFNVAKDFFAAMSPDQVGVVKQHTGVKPIFTAYGIDEQLDDLYDNEARLKSGGSIVITPTEALVSIDVNSGRATREKNIEDTAVKTNVEAAYEVARQLRLRDLAGLVVIDFIDMRDSKNRRAVERALKDALKKDRAKIQVGRISVFGLMEMSRQRMRSSIVEASTQTCPRCAGTGLIRSDASASIKLLRAIGIEAKVEGATEVRLRTSAVAALSLLNSKRAELAAMEAEHEVTIIVDQDNTLTGSAFVVDKPRGHNKRRNPRNEPRKNNNNPPAKEQNAEVKNPAKSQTQKPSNVRKGPNKPRTNTKKKSNDERGNKAVEDAPLADNVGNTVQQQPQNSRPKAKSSRRSRPNNKPVAQEQQPLPPKTAPANDSASGVGNKEADKSKIKGLWEKITQ